ncbi:hypothetical protein ACWCXX_40505 [Streptomyces sp. NPDC001732]
MTAYCSGALKRRRKTPGAFALSLIRTTALDEAARHAPGADGPPSANWELHRTLTETLESRQEDGTLRESSLLLVEWLIAELCAYVAGQVGDRACEHHTRPLHKTRRHRGDCPHPVASQGVGIARPW